MGVEVFNLNFNFIFSRFLLCKKIYKGLNKKVYLLVSIIINLGILFVSKYYNFFIESFVSLFSISNNSSIVFLNVVLPIGISFYTFQTLSYSIDVYYNRIKPENIINFICVFFSSTSRWAN